MLSTIKQNLDKKFDLYIQDTTEAASVVFEEVVLPWLRENKIIFIPGNGGWSMTITEETPPEIVELCESRVHPRHINMFALPNPIYKALTMSLGGLQYNDLGSMMPGYDPRKEHSDVGT